MNYRIVFAAGMISFFVSCNSGDNEPSRNDTSAAVKGTPAPESSRPLQPTTQLSAAWQGMSRQLQALAFSGNTDRDFAMLMKQHHMAAINLSRVEVSGGNDVAIKEMADKIISMQQAEVAEFDQILMKLPASGSSSFGKQALAMIREKDQLKVDSSSVDRAYTDLMIAHHTDAIGIARQYLRQGKHEGLKEIAARMVKEQEKDVNAMKEWQTSSLKGDSSR